MDKDKFAVNQHAPYSWMQQFIGDLVSPGGTSGQPVKDQSQQEALRASWETPGSEAQKLKDIPPAPAASLQARKVQDKPVTSFGRQSLSKSGEAAGEARDSRGTVVQHHTCTCPGCPYSSFPLAPPSIQTLKPRETPLSQAPSDSASRPEDLRQGPCVSVAPEANEPSSTSPRAESSQLQMRHTEAGARSPGSHDSDTPVAKGPAGSLSHLCTYPRLCCHHGFQTCGQLLHHQQGADAQPCPHSHAHHHFHHHHCPFTSCMPCPPLVHSHTHSSAQSPGLFPCLACQHPFPACAQFLRHQHTHSSSQPEAEGGTAPVSMAMHPCMHCAASFPRPSQLLQHQRSQHAHKPAGFLCVECGRAFNSQSNLRIHLNVHTGARPYACPDCGKSFSQSGALKIHRRIHTGERPYSCSYCGRGFPHLAGVRAHQRTHTGEKPYRCPQCGKCFTQSGALKIHTRIHTGERPFVCSLCGKGFSNRSGIRFHHRTVHGLGPEPGAGRAAGESNSWTTRQGGSAIVAASTDRLNTCSDLASPNGPPAGPRMGPPLGSGLPVRPENTPQPLAQSPFFRRTDHTKQAESCGEKDRSGRMYACEDCGLRFQDAPSRNRHQAVEHYSTEEEGGGRRELEEETRRE